MAVTFFSHLSLLQPNPSLSLSPPRFFPHSLSNVHNPSLTGVASVAKRANGVVPKATLDALEANSSLPISVKKSNKNPIVVIDNYDSFTYNLCQTNAVDAAAVGHGEPQDSGISLQTVLELGPTVPLFGVCMGLQCIGEAFGGKIVRSPCGVMHGKSSMVYYDEKGEDGVLAGLSNPFLAGRYHSLVIDKESFPDEELEVTAWTEDGLIMAARHKKYKHLQGVQFHPESIITPEGKTIVRNFVKLIEKREAGGS
ncbi:Anthranilate synthase beta subunit 1 [Spatholobus suberectus]|nr:Anthranilate synthase beta subunit 1 [Spatholobus suberectus]